MKFQLKIALIVALIALALSLFTYPRVGQITFQLATKMESAVYGLEEHQLSIEEFNYSYYDSAPEEKNKSDQVVIMLHGYTADKDVWPRFARHFTDKYRVIIPDLAGHGQTNYVDNASYSAPTQAERLFKFINHLNIKSAHIIGNSMGGFITAHFALKYPSSTLSATLVDPAGVYSPTPSEMDNMIEQGKNPFLIANMEDFANFYPMTMAQPPWLPNFVLDGIAQSYIERRSSYAKIHNDFAGKDLVQDQLDQLKVPSLLMFGLRDRIIDSSTINVWKQKIPHLETAIWEELGHMPMVEAPTLSAQRYLAFLSKH